MGSKWGEGKFAGTADFLQNSLLLSGASAIGGGVMNLGLLNQMHGDLIGKGDADNSALAGSVMMNAVLAAQSTGMLMQSGINFQNMYKASGFHYSQRRLGMAQQGAEAGLSMFNGLSGLTQAGLGLGLGAKTFEARDSGDSNPAGELGVAQNVLGAATSGVSLGARSVKVHLARSRRDDIMGMQYRPSRGLSEEGRKKEQTLFPKLKAALYDAQSKKASGQATDMGKDITQITGSTLKSVGFGIGGDAGKILKGIGAVTNIAATLAAPVINKIRGAYQGKQAEKAGYRNLNEYRVDRVRQLETQDDQGKKSTVSVRVSELASDAAALYDDLDKNCQPASLGVEKSMLATTRLLSMSGETGLMNEVMTVTDSNTRRAAIRNVLLSRTASF